MSHVPCSKRISSAWSLNRVMPRSSRVVASLAEAGRLVLAMKYPFVVRVPGAATLAGAISFINN